MKAVLADFVCRTLFGGPSQPEPTDLRGGIQNARVQAMESESIVNPNQYENDANWQSHIKWTGPQIMKQLPEISVLSVGMGTSGTVSILLPRRRGCDLY